MLLKRIEEKRRKIKEHQSCREQLQERHDLLQQKIQKMELSIKEDEAEYFSLKPDNKKEEDGDVKSEKPKKKASKSRKVAGKRPRETDGGDVVNPEQDKKALSQLKDDIAEMVANGIIPNDLARQMTSFCVSVNPLTEKIGCKYRKLQEMRKEFKQLQKELKDIETGEYDMYMLNAAPFIAQSETERLHEQKAIQEITMERPDMNALCSYLDVLPKTMEDLRVEKMKKAAIVLANTSGRAAPKKKHKSRKKVAQPGRVTPGNINSNIPASVANEVNVSNTTTGEENDILSIFQSSVSLTSAIPNPVTKERNIYAEYLAEVEKDTSKIQQLNEADNLLRARTCPDLFCHGELIESHVNDHTLTCSRCGYCEYVPPDAETGVFDEQNPPQQSAYAYQKKNHFRDWLAKAQGLENRTIPQTVYDALINELRRMHIESAEQVTRSLLRKLLRKLKMSAYYHNLSKIHFHLTGQRPPEFTQEEVEILMDMFTQLEPVFEELKPKNRTNFFSYEYVINKFCQIQKELTKNEEWLRYFDYFKMLKCPEKLYATDKIWKECCRRMGWKFIKSQ